VTGSALLLVVGLGNPGREFEGTRHNVGARAVELAATRRGAVLKGVRGIPARAVEIAVDRELPAPAWAAGEALLRDGERSSVSRLVLAVSQTYMNESGMAVRPLVRRYSPADPEHIVIVHDELDLPPGEVRVKRGGGLAGHNGLRSIRDHLHTVDFVRVRIGIGKPPSADRGAEHVLRRPGAAERVQLEASIARAADAIDILVAKGLEAAMNEIN